MPYNGKPHAQGDNLKVGSFRKRSRMATIRLINIKLFADIFECMAAMFAILIIKRLQISSWKIEYQHR